MSFKPKIIKPLKNSGFTLVWVLVVGAIVLSSIGIDILLKHNKNQNNERLTKENQLNKDLIKTSDNLNKESLITKQEKIETKQIIKKTEIPGLCIPEFAIQTDLPADKFYFDMESGVGAIAKDNGKGIVLYPIYVGSEKDFLERKNTNQSSFISKKGQLKVHKIEDQNNHSVIYLIQSLPYPLLITIFNQVGASSTKKDLEVENDISLLIDSMINKKCEPSPKEFKNNILAKLEASKPINIWLNSIDKNSKANFDLAYSILKSRFDIDTSNFNLDNYYTTQSGNLYTENENSENFREPYYDVFMNKSKCANYIIYKTIQNISQKDKDSFLANKFYKDTTKYSAEEQIWFKVRMIKFAEMLDNEIGKEKISTVHLMTGYFDQVNNDWRDVQKLTGEYCKNIGISFR